MEKKREHMDRYGLFGRDIGYSFSRSYFKAKFQTEEILSSYDNFDCDSIDGVQEYLKDQSIRGFNVTTPYKEAVIPLLDGLDVDAQNIGAVNTIKRLEDGSLMGYNTDFLGFRETLLERFGSSMFRTFKEKNTLDAKMDISHKALILGTGGASKAIVYALESLGVGCQYISRKRTKGIWTYDDLDEEHIKKVTIIVNCTPLGTFPDVHLYPDIPFSYLDSRHIVYDLIYNPPQSQFLAMAKAQNATTINGLRMLELQAEASWAIWNKP